MKYNMNNSYKKWYKLGLGNDNRLKSSFDRRF